MKYIAHLRSEHRQRTSPRSQADTAHLAVKTEMLQLRLMEKRRELVRQDDVTAMFDQVCGIMLTALSGLPARCSRDPAVRRNIELVTHQVRIELAQVCEQMGDKAGEPPLDQQNRQAVETAAG